MCAAAKHKTILSWPNIKEHQITMCMCFGLTIKTQNPFFFFSIQKHSNSVHVLECKNYRSIHSTKKKNSIKDLFSKCDQIRRKLRI